MYPYRFGPQQFPQQFAPQTYGYGYPQPNWAMLAQRLAAQSAGEADVILGGEVDLISGAASGDPDADALLAGLELSQVGLDMSQIGGDMLSGADEIESGARLARGQIQQIRTNPLAHFPKLFRDLKAMKAQPVIADKPYTKTRKLPLGVDSGSEIAAAGSSTLSVVPNGPYKPQFLLIPDDIAQDFVITALNFGRVNGLAGASEVPASTYQESGDARQNEFDVPAVSPGIPIQIAVRNISGAARRFRARFQGTILEA